MSTPPTDPHDDDHGHEHEHGHDGHDHGREPANPFGNPITASFGPDAKVRPAVPADADAVGLVQDAVWRQAYAEVLPAEVLGALSPASFAETWRRSLSSPPAGVAKLLVACRGHLVVGFAAIGPTQDPDGTATTAEVTVLGIHPDARRQGHGSRLLNACVDELREAGAELTNVWILVGDGDTRRFLEAGGFRPDGAFRDRVVSPDGATAREVRLVASLVPGDPDPA